LLGNLFSVSLFYLLIILKTNSATNLISGFLVAFFISSLFLLIYNYVFYGIIYMIIRLSGRNASFGDTFILGQYSALPLLLANLISLGILFVILPAVSVSELTRLIYPYQPIWLVWWILTSIASIWGAVLLTLGIRERYHMSTSIALLTTFTVTVIVVILGWFARLVPIT
jgi:uncharacterized protein with PQ loop repeat